MTEDNSNTTIARRGDWKTEPMPALHEIFIMTRAFTDEQMAALRRGHVPEAMEDKWFWYMEGPALFAHRSWTGFCIYRIDFMDDGRHVVTVNRDPAQYGGTDIEQDAETLNELIDLWTETPYDHYNAWLSEIAEMLKNNDEQ